MSSSAGSSRRHAPPSPKPLLALGGYPWKPVALARRPSLLECRRFASWRRRRRTTACWRSSWRPTSPASRARKRKVSAPGTGLSLRQAQALLSAPDAMTAKGMRDRAIIAVLLGCGLRRSEVAALTFAHVQQRHGRWCIVDLVGKHGRVRTAPMPNWVKVAIDTWTGPAGVSDGYVFRSVNRGDKVQGTFLSEKVVWQMLRPYAA